MQILKNNFWHIPVQSSTFGNSRISGTKVYYPDKTGKQSAVVDVSTAVRHLYATSINGQKYMYFSDIELYMKILYFHESTSETFIETINDLY